MTGTAARGTSVVRRFVLPAVVILVAAASVLWWSRHADDEIDLLPCERLEFPCTFAEVPRDVLERSLALGGRAVERLRTESPAQLAGWLREQPGVVEVLQSDTTVAFRLQSGRRIWLQLDWLTVAGRAPRPSARHGGASGEPSSSAPGMRRLITISPSDKAALPAGRATWSNAARALTRAAGRWEPTLHAQTAAGPARRGGVVGIDFDNDGAITQRDPKRALILVPDPYLYGDEAREVEALLKGTSGYDFEDSVDVRLGPRAGVGAFQIWNDFDLVHVATRGPTVCSSADEWWTPQSGLVVGEGCEWFLLTGSVIDPALVHDRVPRGEGDSPNLGADTSGYQSWLNAAGLEIMAVNNGEGRLEWRVHVSSGFLRRVYPAGVRRALVFLNAANERALTTLGDVLAGAPARTTVIMWRSGRTVEDAGALADRFYSRAAEGWSPGDIFGSLMTGFACSSEDTECRPSAKLDIDLRIREIVSIRAPVVSGQQPPLLEDGQALETLMDDPFAPSPHADFVIDVDGIVPADQDIPVRLELDGRTIAERRLTDAVAVDYNVLRLTLDDVPIDPDVQDGNEHELHAIVSLPRGGESRYAARLTTVDRSCYWEAEVHGPGISQQFSGKGIRLESTERLSILQLDSGVLRLRTPGSDQLTGLTFPLGVPPGEGTFSADGSLIGVFSALGNIAGSTERGLVNVTTLQPLPNSESRQIAGTFEAQFPGLFVGSQLIQGDTVLRGRFVGQIAGTRGCGSETFMWFDAIPRTAGAPR